MKGKLRSFTLVELMVVITVILILAAFTIMSLGPVRAKSRDTRRISDANIIVSALNQYYTEHSRTYPTGNQAPDLTKNEVYYSEEISANSSLASQITEYVSSIPEDPIGGEDYGYVYVYRGDGKDAAVIVKKLESLTDRCNISGELPDIIEAYDQGEVTGDSTSNACYFVKK